ncbi:MCP four helix bundle domain-containing protein [Flavilitoribacter nigricans]|uniref:Chemotaxis protein n=1 Tax=Flavilitoribacter nigricans (strain ATCC 23147 / DSM 23189 / NBRC 102662 / NCIMB 1420 / SS-2) TaxID=1122177 RepID=A0A2D0NER0_FLAN2|nr:MCP four helix bundle domain-containing protein [Flavilitoribacter nigricans]PHN07004.1 chemotaxis protein [Flavilitoribacter nigricans DSM 23189 = NBRC 102662]
MTVFNKIKWVLGILLVFVLVVATNLIDRDNFRRITDSVVSIYEDRLVAKDLIFEFSLLVQEKEIAWRTTNTNFFTSRNPAVNQEISALMARYLETELTPTEARIFDDLQTNLKALEALPGFRSVGSTGPPDAVEDALRHVKQNLHDLSKLQLEEGKRQLAISEQAMATVELFTRLEVYFLILLAVLIQIIILYKPKDVATADD